MVVLDKQDNFTLINIAALSQKDWNTFNSLDSIKKAYQLDSAYSERMFKQLTGKNANIALLPIQVVKDLDTGEVLVASRPTNESLFKLNSKQVLVGLNKSIVKDVIDDLLPQPAFNVGAVINPEARNNLNLLGYTNTQIDSLPAEEREKILKEAIFAEDYYLDNPELEAPVEAAPEEEQTAPEDLKVNGEYIQKGTNLIAKSTIFTTRKQTIFAQQDDIVIVKSIDKENKKVTLMPLGKRKKKTVSFEELSKMFILKQAVMDMTETPLEEMSKEDKDKVSESIDLAATFLNDPTKIAEIEATASTKSVKDLDDELLDDTDC